MDAKTTAMLERLRADPNAAAALLNSPEGKALLRLLTQDDGGAALERAAQNASHGSTAELTALLSGVLKTPQGKALAERLRAAAQKQ